MEFIGHRDSQTAAPDDRCVRLLGGNKLLKKFLSLAALLVLALAGPAPAATWLGIDTNWNNTANWSGGAVPGNGDAVVIPNTVIDPSMPPGTNPATGAFASFEVQTGATNNCLGDTNAINEASGGSVGNPHGIGVTINVSGNATIAGTLSADGRGFTAGGGPGASTASSHGGRSSHGSITYGMVAQPTALGSGSTVSGGNGGGAVKLNVAGILTLNGTITANGSKSGDGWPAAGGSIWLIANDFQGNGVISAIGAKTGTLTEQAGGGRVAIEYVTSSFSGTVSVEGGSVAGGNGQAGSLWEPKRFAGREGSAASPTNITIDTCYQYYFTNTVPVYYWNLTVTNKWAEFHDGALQINDLLLSNGAVLRFDQNTSGSNDMGSLTITGDVTLAAGGASSNRLYLPADGVYNLSGNLNIATNAILYSLFNRTNVNEASGGTPSVPHGMGTIINVSGNATIDGAVSADQLGFITGGPGYGGFTGSYGGWGNTISTTYGMLTQPTALGSGGNSGGTGGGAVKLIVNGILTLNGTLCANGTASGAGWGGSGGSIWLSADDFQGTGVVKAIGGNTGTQGGGGGRIAVEYRTSTFTGTISPARGTGGANGKTGTWFNCVSPFRGTYTTGGYDGVSLASVFSISSNDVKIARVITRWGAAKMAWSEQSTLVNGDSLANTVNYTLTGLTPQVRYCMYTNDFSMSSVRSSATGMLTITNFTLSGTAIAIRVEIPPKGTIVSVW